MWLEEGRSEIWLDLILFPSLKLDYIYPLFDKFVTYDDGGLNGVGVHYLKQT